LPGVGRRVKRKLSSSMEVQFLFRNALFRRPSVIRLPLIRARLKHHGLTDGKSSLSMQPVSEPGSLNVCAKIFCRTAAERHRAKLVTRAMCPATVIPWAGYKIVQMLGVILLQQLINLLRTKEVFLVPPAGHVEIGDSCFAQHAGEGLLPPEIILVGMVYKIVP